MTNKIKLIVGLGNPGPKHLMDRHNAGFWFTDLLCDDFATTFKLDSKYQAKVATASIANNVVKIIQPQTFMNLSGTSTAKLANFFKYNAKEILVIHDELDLPVGDVKLKLGGGHAGHNGLRDIIAKLGSNNFYRLRVGIGHPGHKDLVSPYVLSKPKKDEQELIIDAIHAGLRNIKNIVNGEMDKAAKEIQTK